MNGPTRVFAMLALLVPAPGWSAAAPVPKTAGDSGPMPAGSTWTGELTQRGGGPTGFACTFKVTKRDGEKFEAELYEKTDGFELTYLVSGTLTPIDPKNREKGFKIEFKSHGARDVKGTAEILGVPYTGEVKGKKIKGTWKVPEDSPFNNLEGDFEFEPKKD
ncbi:MAG: hypothetical protein J0I06_08925 [Planctomycetes bacterium]|nr:hypothetical protein [Planctomycetota bacterium]